MEGVAVSGGNVLLLQTTFLDGLTFAVDVFMVFLARVTESVLLTEASFDLSFFNSFTLRRFCSCRVDDNDSSFCRWNEFVVVLLV